MNVRVMKFGGSSVENARCIKKVTGIVEKKALNNKLVIVLSAQKGMTDYLSQKAYEISKSPDRREMDMILATGEQVSIALFAMCLKEHGYKVKSLTAQQVGIYTDKNHTKAKIVNIRHDKLINYLEENDIVIVAGFQGVTIDNEITTLGRGGSDITALALAVILNVKEVDIYSDVNGVYSMDPRKNKEALLQSSVSYEEMLELSGSGAKILQNRSVELATKNNIRINLYSTFTENRGTVVEKEKKILEESKVTSIAKKEDLAVVNYELIESCNNMDEILEVVAINNINIDLFTYNNNSLQLVLEESDLSKLKIVNENNKNLFSKCTILENLSRVSVIGLGMKQQPGFAARVAKSVKEQAVKIELISCSEINISCFINKDEADKTILKLHKELFKKER